jgi:integrase
MARPSRVWFREQTGWYYTTIRGEQIKLSPDAKEAERLLHGLLSKEPEDIPTTALRPSMRKIADLWLDEQQRTKKPDTYRMHKFYLQSFCNHVGKKRVADLKVHTATAWINSHPEWTSESTRTGARAALLACLNWAVAQDLIQTNPLAKMKRGGYTKRERVLAPEERRKLREAAHPSFRPFLFALEQTGARPFSELAKLEASMIDWQTGTARFLDHKNAGKGKHRVIYFTPELLAMLRELAKDRPTGPLFRTQFGNRYTAFNCSRRMLPLCKKLGIPPASVYCYRHTLITEALSKGMTADVVAELVGNSAITIARNYSHLCQMTDVLKQAALRAVS